MTQEFEKIKQNIINAQLSSSPREQLIENISKDNKQLLSANDIIQKLGISADEFQKLVGLADHKIVQQSGVLGRTATVLANSLYSTSIELVDIKLVNKATFPKPDLYILGKARWTKETFKKWLEEQIK